MRHLLALFLLSFMASPAMAADRVIGYQNFPNDHAINQPGCGWVKTLTILDAPAGKPVTLAPIESNKTTLMDGDRCGFAMTETRYELDGLNIYERKDGLLKILFDGKPYWIAEREDVPFVSLEETLKTGLIGLQDDSINALYDAPKGKRIAFKMPQVFDVDIMEFAHKNNEDWAHITVSEGTVCEAPGDTRPAFSGWIKLYKRNGTPALRMYSRGC